MKCNNVTLKKRRKYRYPNGAHQKKVFDKNFKSDVHLNLEWKHMSEQFASRRLRWASHPDRLARSSRYAGQINNFKITFNQRCTVVENPGGGFRVLGVVRIKPGEYPPFGFYCTLI